MEVAQGRGEKGGTGLGGHLGTGVAAVPVSPLMSPPGLPP